MKLRIDNIEVEAREGTTILEAAKSVGIEIPHFCYHPRLSISGNCRMCLVEIEGVKNPAISCRETIREGMVVNTNSDIVKKARSDVLEFILINHPLDCPICDQAGECKLQDYYFKYSLRPSRFTENKVRKPKAVRAGKFVVLDAERCVECARCVRFCEEIADRHEIGICERGDHSTISVQREGALENPYSLCAVDLCPVGALTSADFRFKKRVWFLKSAKSICLGCATGCNVFIDHHDSVAYRYRPRENNMVNKEWLCDAGRMTYKTILAENRVLKPVTFKESLPKEIKWSDAVNIIVKFIRENADCKKIGILSAQSSVEENFAFAEFLKKIIGAEKILWSGEERDPSFADEILRSADKNPNTAGVRIIAKEELSGLEEDSAYFILGNLSQKAEETIAAAKPKFAAMFSSNWPARADFIDVILPKATHAEQDGLFINRNGRLQQAEKAFEPIAESWPTWQIAALIAKALEIRWELNDAGAIRNRMKDELEEIRT